MVNLSIHRQVSFFNDRSPLFLILDGQNMGRLTVINPKTFTIPVGEHTIYVKDLLGFTSPTITINTQDGTAPDLVIVSNRISFLITLVLLLAITFLLKNDSFILPIRAINPILIVMWLLFFAATFIFFRHSFYKIKEEKDYRQ